ncbi:hypothetical protein KR032_005272 [Drosophila birchii]|nr:hypothetical protein KR032_005272 [Drosophila birchii]
MNTRIYLLSELMYGAGLLTAITASPDISMNLRLNENLVSTVKYNFPGLGFVIIRALLVTVLALLPTIVMLPEWLTKHRFLNLLPSAPWILLCCLKFFKHIVMYIFTISHVGLHDNTTNMIFALAIYCIIFFMSIEMMLHWIAVANLSTAGSVVIVRTKIKMKMKK